MGVYMNEDADCLTVAGSAMALLTQLMLWGCVLNSGGGSPDLEAWVPAPHLCWLFKCWFLPTSVSSAFWLGLVLGLDSDFCALLDSFCSWLLLSKSAPAVHL